MAQGTLIDSSEAKRHLRRMNVTLDLPDDAFAKADARAKQESRSLGSVIVDLIRAMKPAPQPTNMPKHTKAGPRFPVVDGRPVTQKEIDRLLLEDGLP
jgi:hypothetical protein